MATMHTKSRLAILLVLAVWVLTSSSQLQAVPGKRGEEMKNFDQVFGLKSKAEADFKVKTIASNIPANILWPGDQPKLTFQLTNQTDQRIQAKGTLDVIRYGTRGVAGNMWLPRVVKLADVSSSPIQIQIDAHGWANLSVSPKIPATKGGYGLVLELDNHGRVFATSLARTFKADTSRVHYPVQAIDAIPHDALVRLGIKALRVGASYAPTTSKRWDQWKKQIDQKMKAYNQANVTVQFQWGAGRYDQPLGQPRPHLNDEAIWQSGKRDMSWPPRYDEDFEKAAEWVATNYGWPNGPVTGMNLWNEPWEGTSIAGWQADMVRYRAIYNHMYEGVEKARKKANVEVLVGGTDSSSNFNDKFFGDGTLKMLPRTDFCSVHYQGLANIGYHYWHDRQSPRGDVRVWDTESWAANTDDRFPAYYAACRATGYDRFMGIYPGYVIEPSRRNVDKQITYQTKEGKKKRAAIPRTYSTAAVMGATAHFFGKRPFKQLLFKKGLPWVMVFGPLAKKTQPGRSEPANADQAKSGQGTVLVVGDLSEAFNADDLPFRTVEGLDQLDQRRQLRKQLKALPNNDASAKKRQAILEQLHTNAPLRGAKMTLTDHTDRYSLYDFYGNKQSPDDQGRIVVPLNGSGFYLRPDATQGSMQALLDAIKAARIDGIEPLEMIPHDPRTRIGEKPTIAVRMTNMLNRPVQGTLSVKLGDLQVKAPSKLSFKPRQRKRVDLQVVGGKPTKDNAYPLTLDFQSNNAGRAYHHEVMHVDVIDRRTVRVDAKLDDWKGALPQRVTGKNNAQQNMTTKAWYPYENFKNQTGGVANGYLAYDDDYFYFAAKIADDTPQPGTIRFADRDDSQFFYPRVSYRKPGGKPQKWPEDVRRYSYRKTPVLPAGGGHSSVKIDNVQLAFNVIAPGEGGKFRRWAYPPGTMLGFNSYDDTDYEFALNRVAKQYGGGTEVWTLFAPGMPRKNFYPRQKPSPKDGPVRGAKLKIRHDHGTRVVECAIPWSAIPLVKDKLDQNKPIKFSYRVNDDSGGGTMELARDRAVSSRNNNAFHVDWNTSWANELEFAFDKSAQ